MLQDHSLICQLRFCKMAAGSTLAVEVTGNAWLQALVESVRAVACLG